MTVAFAEPREDRKRWRSSDGEVKRDSSRKNHTMVKRSSLRRFRSEGRLGLNLIGRPHMQNRHVGHPDPAAARVFLAGHSYGGRQASMLLAEDPGVADGLLLLSYPLHPPKKPTELRTKHFPQLVKPAFLVHGTRDPFATIAELQSTLALIPARHALLEVDGAAHDLLPPKSASDLPTRVAREFLAFVGTAF